LGSGFLLNIDDREPWVVHRAMPFSFHGRVYVIGDAVKLLCADNKIDMRQVFENRSAARLSHASEETENDVGALVCHATKHSHFAERFLICHVADAAGI